MNSEVIAAIIMAIGAIIAALIGVMRKKKILVKAKFRFLKRTVTIRQIKQ